MRAVTQSEGDSGLRHRSVNCGVHAEGASDPFCLRLVKSSRAEVNDECAKPPKLERPQIVITQKPYQFSSVA